MTQQNPFFRPFETSFQMAPFNLIKNAHYLPAIQRGIIEARTEITEITEHLDPPTYENTIEALEASGVLLDRVSQVLFNLNSAETSDEIQKITQEVSPLLTSFNNEIKLNKKLFERVKFVYDLNDVLSDEEGMLLEKTYKSFARNGAGLDSKSQNRYKEITVALSSLALKFGENVLAETNNYELVLNKKEDLAGLPQDLIDRAKSLAVGKQWPDKWIFTLQAPSFIPFMENADHRGLRKQLFIAYMQKAFKEGANDNRNLVLNIVKLRAEMAELLGYDSYASYVLEERMAETPTRVQDFLDDLLLKSKVKAVQEVDEVKVFMRTLGIDYELERWDWAYYAEKLRKKKFDFDDELLKPYFKLEKVINGVFKTAEKLFGLTFKLNDQIPIYHEEVKAYEVWEGQELKAIFLADYFPRLGKRPGAWMTSYRGQKIVNDQRIIPQVSIVCNFTPSTKNRPSLLKFDEVKTLFHEFGHALHGMLADTKYESLSGTSVPWDFVELPSQILENWCYEPECLRLFAHHYETEEIIPSKYIERIKSAATFHEAYATMRQLSFAILDLSLHNQTYTAAQKMDPIDELEKEILAPTNLFPDIPNTNMSVQFSHIFAGGYASGYYSYKWAEVLDADAFECFKEKGIFDFKTAKSFKDCILSQGGTQRPMELYEKFRGAEPTVDALLRRAGLLVSDSK
jgi:peptidyl-dipeptidase Dcp|tara:strand:+ start:1441 stop:3495 length:2055 start_codon:yes stop_codon:yes gene_type:complete